MFPLFETIAIKEGKIANIAWHQQRYEQSLLAFYDKKAKIFNLDAEIKRVNYPQKGLIRCHISYNYKQLKIEYFPYHQRHFRRFHIIECNQIEYHLKYTNRDLLNALYSQRGECDEVIIIKNQLVTDCSIGNLLFLKDNLWYTPKTPLLAGTQRARLLAEGKIKEEFIYIDEINDFEQIKVINALNDLKLE